MEGRETETGVDCGHEQEHDYEEEPRGAVLFESTCRKLVAEPKRLAVNPRVTPTVQGANRARPFRRSRTFLATIRGCILSGLGLIAAALHFWGAREIREDTGEVIFLTLSGGVWLLLCQGVLSWLGLSARDDAVERQNPAALAAVCGGLLAVGCIYAGGSIGEGPSYSNNLFSVALAAAGLFGLWFFFEVCTRISLAITEERDLASGIRFAGFLLALGLMLGRAVAGNWHSASATLVDFVHDGWAVIVLWGIALMVEQFTRPSRRKLFPSWPACGLGPALLYVALAGGWLWHLGAWEGLPK